MSEKEIPSIELESVIKYLPKYRVLLCTACPKSTCIPPKGITTHLREFHKEQFTKAQRTKLAKDAREHRALPPRSVAIPPREKGPVPGLYVRHGFQCNKCDYVCGSEKTMHKKHCRKKHGWVKSQGKLWTEQTIQVNFISTGANFVRRSSLVPIIASISLSTSTSHSLQLFPTTTSSRNSWSVQINATKNWGK